MSKICLIGGGNIGTLLAAEFAAKGYSISVYTSQSSSWSDKLQVYSPLDELIIDVSNIEATNNLEQAVWDAQQIWVTLPVFMFPKIAEELYPLIVPGQIIFCTPGAGAEFYFQSLIQKGGILCGLQRVHSIARLKERGKSVYMLGRKDNLYAAAIPKHATSLCCDLIAAQLDIPCTALDNYLAITLTPSNPVLHTSRLYSMFKDYYHGLTYDRNFFFYEEWTDDASEILLKCDSELQSICRALPNLDLHSVRSLRSHYESDSPIQMTQKIRSIVAFQGIRSPMVETPIGWIPDFNDRYFVADFAFGLKIIRDIAHLLHVSSPSIDIIWSWYCTVTNISSDCYFKLKASSKDELLASYIQ